MEQLKMDRARGLRASNIAAAINADHQAAKDAERAVVRHATDCGRLLIEARASVPHDGWAAWVDDNCCFSMGSAHLYMTLADYLADGDPAKARRVAELSLREIQTLLAEVARPSPAEREKAADRRRVAEEMAGFFLSAGPLERRGFVLGLTILGFGTMSAKECGKQLASMNQTDLPWDKAADTRLNNAGMGTAEGVSTLKRLGVATALQDHELVDLFELAGPQATVLGCILASLLFQARQRIVDCVGSDQDH